MNNFGYQKGLGKTGGQYQNLPSKFVCLTVPKISVEENPLVFQFFSGIEKFFASEGYVTVFDFMSKIFCPTVTKLSVGEPFCAVFQENSGSEKVYG